VPQMLDRTAMSFWLISPDHGPHTFPRASILLYPSNLDLPPSLPFEIQTSDNKYYDSDILMPARGLSARLPCSSSETLAFYCLFLACLYAVNIQDVRFSLGVRKGHCLVFFPDFPSPFILSTMPASRIHLTFLAGIRLILLLGAQKLHLFRAQELD
jgi:hypothetical protein